MDLDVAAVDQDDLVAIAEHDVRGVAGARLAVDPRPDGPWNVSRRSGPRSAPQIRNTSRSVMPSRARWMTPPGSTDQAGACQSASTTLPYSVVRPPGDADAAGHDDHLPVGEQLEVHPRALLDVAAEPAEPGGPGQRPACRRLVLGRGADRRWLKGGESQYGRDRLHSGPSKALQAGKKSHKGLKLFGRIADGCSRSQ